MLLSAGNFFLIVYLRRSGNVFFLVKGECWSRGLGVGGQMGRRRSGKSRAGQTEQTGPQAAFRWTLAGVWRWGGRRWKAGLFSSFFFSRAAKVATCRSTVFRTSFSSGLQHNSQLGQHASCQKAWLKPTASGGCLRNPRRDHEWRYGERRALTVYLEHRKKRWDGLLKIPRLQLFQNLVSSVLCAAYTQTAS